MSEDALGLNKLALIRKLLSLRRERPQLFTGYEPVHVDEDTLAFSRGNGALVVAVKCRPTSASKMTLPEGAYRDVVSGEEHRGEVELRASAVVLIKTS